MSGTSIFSKELLVLYRLGSGMSQSHLHLALYLLHITTIIILLNPFNGCIVKSILKLYFSAKVIMARMNSLRNAFQKMCKESPSGSAPIGKTKRQKEICRLVGFLREHVKQSTSISSYAGTSPSPADNPPFKPTHKSTPHTQTFQDVSSIKLQFPIIFTYYTYTSGFLS